MIHSLPYGTQVITAVAFSLIDTAVGDLGHTAATLLVKQPDTIPKRIEHLNQIFAKLRVIIVDITSMKICHMMRKFLL